MSQNVSTNWLQHTPEASPNPCTNHWQREAGKRQKEWGGGGRRVKQKQQNHKEPRGVPQKPSKAAPRGDGHRRAQMGQMGWTKGGRMPGESNSLRPHPPSVLPQSLRPARKWDATGQQEGPRRQALGTWNTPLRPHVIAGQCRPSALRSLPVPASPSQSLCIPRTIQV